MSYLFVAFAEHRLNIAQHALLESDIALRRSREDATRIALAFGLSEREAGRLAAISAEFEEDAMKVAERHGELFVDAARAVQMYGEESIQASLAIAKLQDFEEEHAFTLGTLVPSIDAARNALEEVEDQERRNAFATQQLKDTEFLFWISWGLLAAQTGSSIIGILRAITAAKAASAGAELAFGGLRAGQITLGGAPLVAGGIGPGGALATVGAFAGVVFSIGLLIFAIQENTAWLKRREQLGLPNYPINDPRFTSGMGPAAGGLGGH